MSAVRLSCFSKCASGEPLRRALTSTSHRLDIERDQVGAVVAAFLEEVADEVAHGHVVSIPGFGAFGAWLIETRAALARDPSRRCKPAFSPSKRFYEQVRKSAPATRWAKGKLIRHRSNHSPRSMTTGSREVPVMTREEFFDSIARQMAQS
jgi:nucleoid DNA-binding protein